MGQHCSIYEGKHGTEAIFRLSLEIWGSDNSARDDMATINQSAQLSVLEHSGSPCQGCLARTLSGSATPSPAYAAFPLPTVVIVTCLLMKFAGHLVQNFMLTQLHVKYE